MNIPFTSRNVALGLLTICLLALVIGLFNAVRLAQDSARLRAAEKTSAVGSLLNKRAHLALIELSGMITMDEADQGGLFRSESNAVTVRKALDEAAKDNSVKGVLLRINTPGGTVGMSQELNEAVQRVSAKKPIVASLGDLAASGGYYTACAADKIIANPGTLTASIGVIITSMDFSELMKQKLGVEAVTIKSGKFKDILSPYRKPTAEDKALVQGLINESYQDFLNAVIAGRTRYLLDPQEKSARIARIKAVADGRVVNGTTALESGLVDEIGDLDEAHEILDQMAKEKFNIKGKERLPLKEQTEGFGLLDVLGMGTQSLGLQPENPVTQLLPLSMRYPNQPLWVLE